MRFTIICRVRHPELLARMIRSAYATAVERPALLLDNDDGQPRLAKSYNLLGKQAKTDFIVFAHDDAIFLTPGWDLVLTDQFERTGVNVLGVVGVDKYCGGEMFSVGHPHCFGKYATGSEDIDSVKVFSGTSMDKILAAVDGFFLAVKADHFKSTLFDETFDGLFYYAEDFCLRSKVGLSDILMGHHKPSAFYGQYPEIKPMQLYGTYFNDKHGILPLGDYGDQRCAMVPIQNFMLLGQDDVYAAFKEKYA